MSNIQNYHSDTPIHPGITILENLEFSHISQAEFSERISISKKHINNIIKGKASITPDIAIKIERSIGLKASLLNNLEKNYQASLALVKANKDLEKEKLLLPEWKETYKQLAKVEIVPKFRWVSSNFSKIVLHLQYFFGVSSLKNYKYQYSSTQAAFRKQRAKTINKKTVDAWLRIGKREAEKQEVSPFDAKKLKNSLEGIKSLSYAKTPKEYIPSIESILADCGVVLVCAPYLKNTCTQGATQWISKGKVMVILKSQKQREDRFLFNLFHEIGHILLHGKSQTFIDLKDDIESSQEKEANNFAQKMLLPKFDNQDIDYCNPSKDIDRLSKYYTVSPSLIIGQIQYKTEDYSFRASEIRKVNYLNV